MTCWVNTDVLALGCEIWPAGWIHMYWLCLGYDITACWVDTDVLALGYDITQPAGWIQMCWLWVVTSYSLLGGYRCIGFGL